MNAAAGSERPAVLYQPRALERPVVSAPATSKEARLTEQPPHPEPSTPRWVKVAAAIALVVVVVLVVVMLVGGNHGPGRHALAMQLRWL